MENLMYMMIIEKRKTYNKITKQIGKIIICITGT